MAALEKGITRNGTGYSGKMWNILGQVYFPKAVTDSTFAFETNSDPGQFVPVHIHPTQDEFILVQDGMRDLKLDGVWVEAKAGDLVRLPRGIPHGYFNKIRQAGPGAVLGVADAKARRAVQSVA
jgi:quercetin dioxygenase-like cupin family protein